jgi:hypothetical protein
MTLGVDSASNRNEYQESSWGVKSGRRIGLTTMSPSVSRIPENVGTSTFRNPKRLHGRYRDNFTFTFISGNLPVFSRIARPAGIPDHEVTITGFRGWLLNREK